MKIIDVYNFVYDSYPMSTSPCTQSKKYVNNLFGHLAALEILVAMFFLRILLKSVLNSSSDKPR